jgi:hypothetical protein
MQLSTRRRALVVWVSALALVALVGLWLRPGPTAARAGSPPPDQPQFSGLAVRERFPVATLRNRPAMQAPAAATDWTVTFEEAWENGFDDAVWLTIDRNGATGGEYKWADRAVTNPLNTGLRSAWAVGGGEDGQAKDPADGGYPGGVDSWLIYGPFSLSGASDAELSFTYAFEADAGDTFSVLASTDGADWNGQQIDSGDGSWQARNFTLADYAGQPKLYLAFRFASDNSGDPNKGGAWVDDIALRGNFGTRLYLPHIQLQPTPTATATATPPPTPTPTATAPAGRFEDNFGSDISGWEARRTNNGASFSVGHRADSDANRQGALELLLGTTNSYVLVSPLVPAKQPPYNIEVMAKLKDTQDQHMYGIVFGGDWNGGACNAPGSDNCFTSYYELRVQYRKFGSQQFQELKLVRVDGHDAAGNPISHILQDWIKGGNIGPDDWAEIDIRVQANGIITLYWNGKYIAEKQDASLVNQPYFGLLLLSRENGNARVKYDYIKID